MFLPWGFWPFVCYTKATMGFTWVMVYRLYNCFVELAYIELNGQGVLKSRGSLR